MINVSIADLKSAALDSLNEFDDMDSIRMNEIALTGMDIDGEREDLESQPLEYSCDFTRQILREML